ncbi:MAG: type IV pilus assembly protein PilM [Proteobacteria bacterium]|nr:type IV pilus assembly protein PilM [Pseudomonadota bacterium]
MFSFGKKSIVALDIGSYSVKLVQLSKTKKGYNLANLASMPLSPEAIVDGALMDTGTIVDIVRELMAGAKLKLADVAASVSGHSVIIKKIVLPATTEEELADSIQWEAEQYIPFDIADVNLDFQILGEAPGDSSQIEVLLVAAKKEIVDDYTAVLTEAGLNPVILDVDAFAVQNMLELNYDFEEGDVIASVNVGAELSMVNVFKDGISIFNRDVSNAGNRLTQEIQKHFSLSHEEAEAAKLGAEVEGLDASELKAIFAEAVESLSSEVARTIDFFMATNPEDKIVKLYLSGGAAGTAGLRDLLSEKLGFPVEIADPFNSVVCDEKKFDPDYLKDSGPSFAVALGLAIREAGD